MTPKVNVDPMTTLGEMLQSGHGDALLAMLAHVLREVMNAEASMVCGAGLGERSTDRENQRNGYRDRPFETRLGTLELAVPKLRHGSYFPSFLTPRRRWEQAFVNVVATAYVEGVSTRKMEELVEAMGAKGMSKSEVSRMAASLDEQVKAFRERRLEKEFPYLWLDAMYVKVREGGRIVSKAVLVCFGVNQDGEREVLGVDVANGEMQRCWQAFLHQLLDRGLRGYRLVISDAHSGLRGAIRAVLNGATWQRCYGTSSATSSRTFRSPSRASSRPRCGMSSSRRAWSTRRKRWARSSRCSSRSTRRSPSSSSRPRTTSSRTSRSPRPTDARSGRPIRWSASTRSCAAAFASWACFPTTAPWCGSSR